MKRRTFIRGGWMALTAATAGAGSYYLMDFKQTARSILLEDSSALNLEDDAVDRFITEAGPEGFWDEFSWLKKTFITASHLSWSNGIRLPYHNKYRHYRDLITGQFLFSTDFFYHRDVPRRKIKYLGFYNPYIRTCSNPFVIMT